MMNTNFTLKVQRRRIFCKEEDCITKFGMSIPDEIHLSLSQAVISKMRKMMDIVLAENISTIEMLSSHCDFPDSSYATLYKDGKELTVSYFKYKMSDLTFPTIDLKAIPIICGADINKFEVVFTYINSAGERLKIRTATFKIDV